MVMVTGDGIMGRHQKTAQKTTQKFTAYELNLDNQQSVNTVSQRDWVT